MKALDTFLFEKLKINKDTISADVKKPLKFIDELIDYLGNKVNMSDLYMFKTNSAISFMSTVYTKLAIYFGIYYEQIPLSRMNKISTRVINLESGSIDEGDFYIVLKDDKTVPLKTRLDGSNQFIKFAYELAKTYLDNYDDLDKDDNVIIIPEKDILEQLVDAGYNESKIKDILYYNYNSKQ